MHERGLRLEQRRVESSARLELERAVVADAGDAEPDFVYVGDEHDDRVALAHADPEVAGGVRLGFRPRGEQGLHLVAHRALGAGNTVRLREAGKHLLCVADRRRVLCRKATQRRNDGNGKQRERQGRGLHGLASIHATSPCASASASCNATVSTAVSTYRAATLAVFVSAKGPSKAFTLARPASPVWRLCTVIATTTVPRPLGFAWTAAASAAQASRL